MTTNTQNSSTIPTRSQPPNRLRGQQWRGSIAQYPHQPSIRRLNRIRNALGLSSWTGIHCLHTEGLLHFRDRNELVIGDRLTGWIVGDDFGPRERLGGKLWKPYQDGEPGRLGGVDLVRRAHQAVAVLANPADLIAWRAYCLLPQLRPDGKSIASPVLWTDPRVLPGPTSSRIFSGRDVLLYPWCGWTAEKMEQLHAHIVDEYEPLSVSMWEPHGKYRCVADLAQDADREEGIPGETEQGLVSGDDLGLSEFLGRPTVGFPPKNENGRSRERTATASVQ